MRGLVPVSPRLSAALLFLRFGVVGLLNTAFGYAVFAALILAGLWPGAAIVTSTIVGVAFNFQTSRRLVFRSRGRVIRFVGLYCAVLALNWSALRALHSTGLNDLRSQALLVLPLAAISFAAQRTFVFGPRTEAK
jgi:putative flippase GtrA